MNDDDWATCECGRRHWQPGDRPDARCLPCRLLAAGKPVPWWWGPVQGRLGEG